MYNQQRRNKRIRLLIVEVNKLGSIEDRSRCLIARYGIAIKQRQNQASVPVGKVQQNAIITALTRFYNI